MGQKAKWIKRFAKPLLSAVLFALSATLIVADVSPEGYATGMKIPLNVSVQDVVNVLDKEGAVFTGAFREKDREALLQSMRRGLGAAYDRFMQTNKEVALKLFDKTANRALPSFFHRGEKYFVAPSSFRCLGGTYVYQVFEKNPQPYFSQYALTCEALPPSLRLFGMSQAWIVFTSFEGEPPRSCIVAYANPLYPDSLKSLPTIPILRNRYGQPRLHFGISDTCPEAICKLDSLQKLLPGHTQKTGGEAILNPTLLMVSLAASPGSPTYAGRSRGKAIWDRLVTTGCANDNYGDGILSFPFVLPRTGGMRALPAAGDEPVSLPCPAFRADADCTADFTLEWRLGSTRILVGGIDFLGGLASVHYIYYPAFSRLQPLYARFYDAARHQQEIEPRPKFPSQ